MTVNEAHENSQAEVALQRFAKIQIRISVGHINLEYFNKIYQYFMRYNLI